LSFGHSDLPFNLSGNAAFISFQLLEPLTERCDCLVNLMFGVAGDEVLGEPELEYPLSTVLAHRSGCEGP